MILDVVTEQRFFCCKNGKYWTPNSFPYPFWLRYLSEFDAVNIVARAKNVDEPSNEWQRVDGEGVCFTPIPYYIGPKQMFINLVRIIKAIHRLNDTNKVILRIPGTLSILYYIINIFGRRRYYGVEVVGDPSDSLNSNSSTSYISWLYLLFFVFFQKLLCKHAVSISYVTSKALQIKYPPNQSCFSTSYSSIFLESDWLKRRYTYPLSLDKVNLIGIGNLFQPNKGADLALHIIYKLLFSKNVDARLNWIGDGPLIPDLKNQACILDISEKVKFLGNISSRELMASYLDASDIFIMPSRAEGLPRALIEAMGRGLICIATNVGGISELLSKDFLVQPDNSDEFIDIILSVLSKSEEEVIRLSKRNYLIASEYKNDILDSRRRAMYKYLKSYPMA